jgi:hypothetical protein
MSRRLGGSEPRLNHKGHKDHKEKNPLNCSEILGRLLGLVTDASQLVHRSRHPDVGFPPSFFVIFVSFVVKMI